MKKTILADVDGFTPVIDVIVEDLGLMSAVVFGRIWRYCQMEDKVCKASLDAIGGGIGIDKATVMRHAKELCDAGYLKDLTPELRNRPHVYVDTGKAGISISIGVAQSNARKQTVAERNAGVAQSNATVAESKLNKDIKKDSKKDKRGATPSMPKAIDIPELVLFRDTVKHFPKQNQREAVIEAIRKVNDRLFRPATVDDLAPFWKAWAVVSGNEWSLVWLVEWAVSGIIPKKNGASLASKTQQAVNQFMNMFQQGPEVIDVQSE